MQNYKANKSYSQVILMTKNDHNYYLIDEGVEGESNNDIGNILHINNINKSDMNKIIVKIKAKAISRSSKFWKSRAFLL